MSSSAQRIISEAMNLSSAERAQIAEELISSLDEQPDEEVEKAWHVEINRRIDEVESGTVQCVPWEEVLEKLRASARARKPGYWLSRKF